MADGPIAAHDCGDPSGCAQDEDRRQLIALLAPLAPIAAPGVADRLLAHFGTLDAVLAAEPDARRASVGEPRLAQQLDAIADTFQLVLRQRIQRGPVLTDSRQLRDYLLFRASHGRFEIVRALYLNSHRELLCAEILARGSTTEAPLDITNILRRALQVAADSFILVHNHPSGDPTPSRADKAITQALAAGARAIGIPLLDHIIVSRGAWLSFREQGFL